MSARGVGYARRIRLRLLFSALAPDPWCSGQTCQPVTLEIAGSNPVGSAIHRTLGNAPGVSPFSASVTARARVPPELEARVAIVGCPTTPLGRCALKRVRVSRDDRRRSP